MSPLAQHIYAGEESTSYERPMHPSRLYRPAQIAELKMCITVGRVLHALSPAEQHNLKDILLHLEAESWPILGINGEVSLFTIHGYELLDDR